MPMPLELGSYQLPWLELNPISIIERAGGHPDPVHQIPDAEPAKGEQLEDPSNNIAGRSLREVEPVRSKFSEEKAQ